MVMETHLVFFTHQIRIKPWFSVLPASEKEEREEEQLSSPEESSSDW